MKNIVENGIRVSAWMGRYFFELVHMHVKDRALAEDVMFETTHKFLNEFRDKFETNNWTPALSSYNVDTFDDLIYKWGRQTLWADNGIDINLL